MKGEKIPQNYPLFYLKSMKRNLRKLSKFSTVLDRQFGNKKTFSVFLVWAGAAVWHGR